MREERSIGQNVFAMTEKAVVELLHGHLQIVLETMPRHGQVAYTVWPCSIFLLNTLAGWRLKELESGHVGAFDPDRMLAHMESWSRVDPAAQRIMLQRSRWSQLMRHTRVVDLGSGTGVVGIALRSMGSDVVVATDMPKCMHLLERNVSEWNSTHGKDREGVIRAVPLSWESYSPGDIEKLLEQESGSKPVIDGDSKCMLDIVIACDCVYGTDHIGRSPIVPIVRDFILSPADARSTCRVVLVAYESRDNDIEESFWYQIAQCKGLQRVMVASCEAEASEGNEKESTTYEIHAIFASRV